MAKYIKYYGISILMILILFSFPMSELEKYNALGLSVAVGFIFVMIQNMIIISLLLKK